MTPTLSKQISFVINFKIMDSILFNILASMFSSYQNIGCALRRFLAIAKTGVKASVPKHGINYGFVYLLSSSVGNCWCFKNPKTIILDGSILKTIVQLLKIQSLICVASKYTDCLNKYRLSEIL